jgi:hypothetical protein
VTAILTLACLFAAQPQPNQPAAPKSLLIYYGWPSTINGANRDVAAATKHFDLYDFVVLGDGLQNPKHGDHKNTVAIIAASKAKFFGYVDLGVSTSNLTLPQITDRLEAWTKMGVVGVLLDDFGYDYKVTRQRQNAAVDAAHKLNLRVIANAWIPADAFAAVDGELPSLTKNDVYLWESYRFKEGAPVPVEQWRKKAEAIAVLREKIPFEVYSVSTTRAKTEKLQESFAHQWFCAAIDGHAATGWGHPSFGSRDGLAPATPPPAGKNDLGVLTGERVANGSVFTRATSTGQVEVDAGQLTGKFTPKK